jgi:hypothetical protein
MKMALQKSASSQLSHYVKNKIQDWKCALFGVHLNSKGVLYATFHAHAV